MLSNSVIAAGLASGYLTALVLQLNPSVSIEPATLVPLATVLGVAYGANLTVLFYALIVLRQILAVEVLSPGTASYDRGAKLRHYQQVPSLRAVVLAESERVQVDVFSREPDGRWVHTVFDDPAGELVVPGLPAAVRIPLAEVYRDVGLPDRPPLRHQLPPDQTPGGLVPHRPPDGGRPGGE